MNSLITLAGISISLILSKLISGPIIKLNNFTNHIIQQNLSEHIIIEGHDEIADLAKSINKMLDHLSQASIQLGKASHDAGMAEVATSVLHNVGNILNSMNVSTQIIYEIIAKSKLVDLQKVNDMLIQKKDNLSEFLQKNEKGKRVIPYLQTLNKQLNIEQTGIKTELEGLQTNLQHVNNVVAMQQSHAKNSGVVESISLPELINTICEMNKNKLKQANIVVTYDFSDVSPIQTVKTKVEQILINIIVNSIEALEENKSQDSKIIIILRKINDILNISIKDNGIGIAKENLSQIFSFGFTTKVNGHGYGMHNSCLLAKELGGELTVQSEGLGKGAIAILELPYKGTKKSD